MIADTEVPRKADAAPTKEFFVRMITKDISLEDCILDLVDNCLDGARRAYRARDGDGNTEKPYDGYYAELAFDGGGFTIKDNCGGISMGNAIDYAFRFGKGPGGPADLEASIGLYGIGMKRAVLKIGKNIEVRSSTEAEAFLCTISVDEWLEHDDWVFDLDNAEVTEIFGTTIQIRNLCDGIENEFSDPTFMNRLTAIMSRDYALFIEKGFKITINRKNVRALKYTVRQGNDFVPLRTTYDDEGVRVEIFAGMAALPNDDREPNDRTATTTHGWYVLCNDRVVLAADKTERTIWGVAGCRRWHQQYHGFVGMVFFRADNPRLLPWTTTKRGVDLGSPLYRRAVSKMREATEPWIRYTGSRKHDLVKAKELERGAVPISLLEIPENPRFGVPEIQADRENPMTKIRYEKPRNQVKMVAEVLGNSKFSNKSVGEQTFEYFLANETD